MSLGVDQRRASAQGDVVGRDKITELHIHEATGSSGGVVGQLIRKLEAEIAGNAKTQETADPATLATKCPKRLFEFQSVV
jgi:hypothetical protein